jgi:hypothetical protein
VNFDDAPAGICLVWHLSYEEGLQGAMVGANANDLMGCFSLSNPIEVIRVSGEDCNTTCNVDGGSIATSSGGTKIEQCAGAVKFGVRHTTASDAHYYYVITDDQDVILEFVNSEEIKNLDLSAAPAGICRVWGWSTDGNAMPVRGESISTLDNVSCGELSQNFITVIRLSDEECNAFCHAPRNVRVSSSGRGVKVRWEKVNGARSYEIKIAFTDSEREIIIPVRSRTIRISSLGGREYNFSVRAICSDGSRSDYSEEILVNEGGTGELFATNRSEEVLVEEINEDAKVSFYPNPVSDQLNVSINGVGSAATVSVYDLLGSLKIRQNISVGQLNLTVDMSQLTSGIYLLQVTDENQIICQDRIVKTGSR